MSRPLRTNHFEAFDPSQFSTQGTNDQILSNKVGAVMREKFKLLVTMYLKNAFETGYNSALAFRVIGLYLYLAFKPSEDTYFEYNLLEQVNRFMEFQLSKNELPAIQKCLDLLLIKQLRERVPQKAYSYWKIRFLAAVKKFYASNHQKKEKKKASLAMRELCKQQLKHENIRHDQQMYNNIMKTFIAEERIIMNSKRAHGKKFEAIENGNNIVRALQKAEQALAPAFQQHLMQAYWDLSKIHDQLHYATYARKYAEYALNIADRIKDFEVAEAARNFLEKSVYLTNDILIG